MAWGGTDNESGLGNVYQTPPPARRLSQQIEKEWEGTMKAGKHESSSGREGGQGAGGVCVHSSVSSSSSPWCWDDFHQYGNAWVLAICLHLILIPCWTLRSDPLMIAGADSHLSSDSQSCGSKLVEYFIQLQFISLLQGISSIPRVKRYLAPYMFLLFR